MSADIGILKSMFSTNAQMFEATAKGVPEDKWLIRPGETSNHMTWVVGHIVVHRAAVSKILGGTWSAPWEGLFARGAKLVPPDRYPNPTELQSAWDEVTAKLSVALEQASPQVWAKPVPQQTFSLDGTIGGSVGILCLHETYHMGQLGFLKKILGCGQSFG
jgi:uncharacterized damage-inducible protein DinB